MTRDEGVTWLKARGLDASARDWGMGATIVIPLGSPTSHNGIKVWPRMACLYPSESGEGWWLRDSVELHDNEDRRFSSLPAALEAVLETSRHVR